MSCKGYKMTRRAMMGATGATVLGLSVRDLIAYAGSSHAPTAEHVILFWNGGGMSHVDTWDPKPGRPVQGDLEPINTTVPGIQISEIFPQVAQQMEHAALIRSIAGTQGDHGRATYNLQTSYLPGPNLRHPGFGSVVAHELDQKGDLPTYVSISGQAPRAGYLGQKCEAYYVSAPGDKDPYLAFPEGIAEVRGNRRLEVLEKYNKKFASKNDDPRLSATQTSIDDAVRLMRSPALEAFELQKVPSETLERYGDTAFGRGALLARRLVENGVRFVQVNRGG
ncbi:MAG TPA: DUF1501 domain-containing protein, partial [Planctomycetaceae bacterium]|nr:DUF1501 domain-containing protein [Planctomycetaceae bacterium]